MIRNLLWNQRESEVADDVCVRNGEEVPCFSVRGKMETGASKDIDEREVDQ